MSENKEDDNIYYATIKEQMITQEIISFYEKHPEIQKLYYASHPFKFDHLMTLMPNLRILKIQVFRHIYFYYGIPSSLDELILSNVPIIDIEDIETLNRAKIRNLKIECHDDMRYQELSNAIHLSFLNSVKKIEFEGISVRSELVAALFKNSEISQIKFVNCRTYNIHEDDTVFMDDINTSLTKNVALENLHIENCTEWTKMLKYITYGLSNNKSLRSLTIKNTRIHKSVQNNISVALKNNVNFDDYTTSANYQYDLENYHSHLGLMIRNNWMRLNLPKYIKNIALVFYGILPSFVLLWVLNEISLEVKIDNNDTYPDAYILAYPAEFLTINCDIFLVSDLKKLRIIEGVYTSINNIKKRI